MRERKVSSTGHEGKGHIEIATSVVLAVCVLVLAMVGAATYVRILKEKQADAQYRSTLMFLRTQLNTHDTTGGVSLSEDGTMLILHEQNGVGLNIRIRGCRDGNRHGGKAGDQDGKRQKSGKNSFEMFHIGLP